MASSFITVRALQHYREADIAKRVREIWRDDARDDNYAKIGTVSVMVKESEGCQLLK